MGDVEMAERGGVTVRRGIQLCISFKFWDKLASCPRCCRVVLLSCRFVVVSRLLSRRVVSYRKVVVSCTCRVVAVFFQLLMETHYNTTPLIRSLLPLLYAEGGPRANVAPYCQQSRHEV
jgi:hypothetical protein